MGEVVFGVLFLLGCVVLVLAVVFADRLRDWAGVPRKDLDDDYGE